jgi:hypothetical protein
VGPWLARDLRQRGGQLRLIDVAVSTVIHAFEQPIKLPLETAHPVPFVTAVVAFIVHAVMGVMACTGAAQECHRTVDELFLRDGAILVSIKRIEQDLGTARGA